MPSTRTLVLTLLVGSALFVLFAFTLIGLLGELAVVLAGVGLLLRGLCDVTARVRGVNRC